MPDTLNYRHLYYFWVVVKEGGFSRAAERLGVAVQTISVQVRELEQSLGCQLLKPDGRGVALTEAGSAAFSRAEEIFQLGQLLPQEVRQAAHKRVARLAVGLSDGISKLAAHALLAPVLHTPDLHLVCHEDEFDRLLVELSLHHIDVVLAGQAAPSSNTLRLTSERLVASPVDWYGPATWVKKKDAEAFPACLATLPVLLPTGHSELRRALDRWFHDQGLRPNVVGEFEDSALMAVFAVQGMGVFPVSRFGAERAGFLKGLRLLGSDPAVCEEVYAIRTRRGYQHALVGALVAAVKGQAVSAALAD